MAATKYFDVEIEVKVTPVNGVHSPKKGKTAREVNGKTVTFKRRFPK